MLNFSQNSLMNRKFNKTAFKCFVKLSTILSLLINLMNHCWLNKHSDLKLLKKVVYFLYSRSDTAYNHNYEILKNDGTELNFSFPESVFFPNMHSLSLYRVNFIFIILLVICYSLIVYLCYSVHGCAPEREQLKPHQYPSSESQWYDHTHTHTHTTEIH